MPTTGVAVAAAMCSGPVSPPTNSRLRPISALSSCRSNSPGRRCGRPRRRAARAPPPQSVAAASRSDGPELSTSRRRACPAASAASSLDEERLRPAPERIARAHVHARSARRPSTHARVARRSAILRVGAGIERHLDRVAVRVRRAARPSRDRLRAGPTGSPPSASAAVRAARWTTRVYIQRAPWMS